MINDCNLKLPKKGKAFYAWKKVWLRGAPGRTGDFVLLKLRIPARAERVTCSFENPDKKCRSERVFVEGVYSRLTGREIKLPAGATLQSHYYTEFKYNLKKMAISPNYDEDPDVVCSGGIHFFLNKKSAMNYFF